MGNVVPNGAHVVVQPAVQERGGISVAGDCEAGTEPAESGRVLSLGDGPLTKDGQRVAFQVCEGDRVLYSRSAGTRVKLGRQTVLIMTEADILAIVG